MITTFQDKFNYIYLPTPLVEAMLSDSWLSFTLFVALRFAGYTENRLFTVDQATEIMNRYAKTDKQKVRRALRHPLFKSDQRVHTPRKGQPRKLHRMPGDHEIMRHYELVVRGCSYTLIPVSALAGGRAELTMAIHESLIARRMGQYSRNWLARRLGIAASTLRKWEKMTRVVVTPIITEIDRITRRNIAKALKRYPDKAERGAEWLSIRLPSLDDGNGAEVTRRRINQHNIIEAIKAGFMVLVMKQECNFYHIPAGGK